MAFASLLQTVLNESDDRGVGLEPILVHFVYNTMIPPDVAQKRIKEITAYYQEIFSKSKNVKVAYEGTMDWATSIYKPKVRVEEKIDEITSKAEGIYSFWVLPNGKKIDVPDGKEHFDVLKTMSTAFGFNTKSSIKSHDDAVARGAIRVAMVPSSGELNIHSRIYSKTVLDKVLRFVPFKPESILWDTLVDSKSGSLRDFNLLVNEGVRFKKGKTYFIKGIKHTYGGQEANTFYFQNEVGENIGIPTNELPDEDIKELTEGTAEDIQDLIDIQVNDPIVKKEPYFAGLANGLIVAKACVSGEYIDDELVGCPPNPTNENKDEKEAWFEERTNKHIQLVQKAAKQIEQAHVLNGEDCGNLMNQVKNHDQSKFEEPERTPYISLTWRHKLENETGDPLKSYKTPGLLAKEDENQATLHHIKNNPHHPEYWNKEEANIDPKDRNKSVKCIDASAMSDLAIAEMVADWQAMSWELKKNTAREWFNKQKDVRWHFSDKQVTLIDKLLKVFETNVKENKVTDKVISKSHDYPVGLFWWDFKDNKLFYENYSEGLYHRKTKDYTTQSIKPTVARGRVYKDNDHLNVLLYSGDFKYFPVSQDSINELVKQITNKTNSFITYVVDETGTNLMEKKKD